MASSGDRTGDDPTRTEPGGTNTTTKITEESALGSDRGGGDEPSGAPRSDKPASPPLSR